MDKPLRIKIIAAIAVLLFVLILINTVSTNVSRSGLIKLTVEVVPSDSNVQLNGKDIQSGANYVKPGSYTLVATKDGFREYTKEVVVRDELTVGLVPEPESEDAKAWLEQNPNEQLKRESIGGDNAILYRDQSQASTPIVKQLPYTDLVGPFTIDYGPDKDRRDSGVMLIISDSTAPGRYAAQEWIESQGQSLSEINVVYYDYVNQLVEAGGRAH